MRRGHIYFVLTCTETSVKEEPTHTASFISGMVVQTRSWRSDRGERDFCAFQLHCKIYFILFSDIQGLNNTIIRSYLDFTVPYFDKQEK